MVPVAADECGDEVLDARGLVCPMPVIRLQQWAAHARPDSGVLMICRDRGALQDIPAWCRLHGHTVTEARDEGAELRFRIRVSGGA